MPRDQIPLLVDTRDASVENVRVDNIEMRAHLTPLPGVSFLAARLP